MELPKRIQRKRAKGWEMPKGAIYVGRPTKYGNIYDWEIYGRAGAVKMFEQLLDTIAQENRLHRFVPLSQYLRELRGHDLCCWCRLDQPCHGDVWLKLANR